MSETYLLNKEEKKLSIEKNLENKTAVPRNWVQDTETAIMEEQKDMTTVTWKPKTGFDDMLNTNRDIVSDLACSEDEQDP
jgi:hypothetical protein